MKNQFLLFKSCVILTAACFNMAAEAVQAGDQIKIPFSMSVYPNDGLIAKERNLFKRPSCEIGSGDAVEVLRKSPYDGALIVKYLPGHKNWKGKCPSETQTLRFSPESRLDLFSAYNSLEPDVRPIEEAEKPSKEILGNNHNSADVSEGQVFSVFTNVSLRLMDVNFEFSLESVLYPFNRWILQKECGYFYGYKLKITGFINEHFAYTRLMEPENEKQVVKKGIYYNCPAGSLFQTPIPYLIENEVLYRESLKVREDFLRSFLASRTKNYDLFDVPLTVDGLTVGETAWFDTSRRGSADSIQNIDFDYLEKLSADLESGGHYLSGREDAKSFVEDLNPSVFTTIPMINYWSCRPARKTGAAYYGKIIGFSAEPRSLGILSRSYSSARTRFAITESSASPPKRRFFLFPVSSLIPE